MQDAPKTKKMLVAFDPEKPEKASSDFLVPVVEEGKVVLFGTKSRRVVSHGMVVFVGREITVNDVFGRLVDSGRTIPAVAEALAMISICLSYVSVHKIGQIVQISEDSSPLRFALELTKIAMPVRKRSLP